MSKRMHLKHYNIKSNYIKNGDIKKYEKQI